MKCALATCNELLQTRIHDDELLADALLSRNVEVDRVAWEDKDYSWSKTDVVVIRSAWNSHREPVQYLRWASYVSSVSALLNPLSAIQWNIEKARYFRDLWSAGVPLVPTIVLPYGKIWNLANLLDETGWERAVLKPSIGANAYATSVIEVHDGRVKGVPDHLPACDMLFQPYLYSVNAGEQSHVFLAGTWSHCFLKEVPFAVRSNNETPIPVREQLIIPDIRQIEVARSIFQTIEKILKIQLMYARIDLVYDNAGRICLMEAEINEPALHLESDGAASLFAASLINQYTNSYYHPHLLLHTCGYSSG